MYSCLGLGVGGNLPVDASVFLECLPPNSANILSGLATWWSIGTLISRLVLQEHGLVLGLIFSQYARMGLYPPIFLRRCRILYQGKQLGLEIPRYHAGCHYHSDVHQSFLIHTVRIAEIPGFSGPSGRGCGFGPRHCPQEQVQDLAYRGSP